MKKFLTDINMGGNNIENTGNIYDKTQTDELIDKKPGLKVEGDTFTIDGSDVVAGKGSEIFNNYENNKATGNDSHAEGSGTTASGQVSHAEGSGTTASGQVSHAEGSGTKALGVMSHAEGSSTTASGSPSHAEGQSTTASGPVSHAEGSGTTASGPVSHAEGQDTEALGVMSHAEGSSTTASGNCSHAEGSGTTASGQLSHTEGSNTSSYGSASHAEGHSTNRQDNVITISSSTSNDQIKSSWDAKKFSLAKGDYSHVEGLDNVTLGKQSHAEGAGNIVYQDAAHAEGAGNRIFLDTTDQAGAGGSHVEGTDNTVRSSYSHAEGVYNTICTKFSHIEGTGNQILGNTGDKTQTGNAYVQAVHMEGLSNTSYNVLGAHIEGISNKMGQISTSTGTQCGGAHVEGTGNTVLAKSSHAEGGDTTVTDSGMHAHAEGFRTTSASDASHAEGSSTYKQSDIITISSSTTNNQIVTAWTTKKFSLAKGNSSHVEGRDNLGLGDFSHAEGFNTTASGKASHAEGGNGTTASGEYAHAEGNMTTASGNCSHTEGAGTRATAQYAHAEGSGSNAAGESSHAEGASSASGNYSHAEGSGTTASGGSSHAEGSGSMATVSCAHAEGSGTKALGESSHAEGTVTMASGNYSHAEGKLTTTFGVSSHAEGQATNLQSDVITISDTTTNDAIITAWNGKKFSLAKGEASHVEGKDNLGLGDFSHTEGEASISYGPGSHAEGGYTIAYGQYSHTEGYKTSNKAVGPNTSVEGQYTHSEGQETKAVGTASHAEGYKTSTYYPTYTINTGKYSHAEGRETVATGEASHVEGYLSNTHLHYYDTNSSYNMSSSHVFKSGNYAHAEGWSTTAVGTASHAEGYNTDTGHFLPDHSDVVYGDYAHAEGWNTSAVGTASHAEGYYTKASSEYQHVQGKYNIEDTENKYAFIIGNGTDHDARSNAFAVDWNGNVEFAGDIISLNTEGNTVSLVSVSADVSDLKSDIAINKTTIGASNKNLLKITATDKTEIDVEFKINSNGSVTASTTRTEAGEDNRYFILNEFTLKRGKYIFTGDDKADNGTVTHLGIYTYQADGTYINYIESNKVFEVTDETVSYRFSFIYMGSDTETFTFYPMLRYADIKDETFEIYKPNIDERLIQDRNDIAVNKTTIGTECKNLLKNMTSTVTTNGITFTMNDDGSITANGTATENSQINLYTITDDGKYILTGCPKGGSGTTYCLSPRYVMVDDSVEYGVEYGAGLEINFDSTKYKCITIRLQVWSGVTVSDLRFYPMLRYADIIDNTYEPYKPSIDERLIQDKSDITVNRTALGTTRKNIFNLSEYLNNITTATRGTITKTNNGVMITATTADAYTYPALAEAGAYQIPVEPNTSYTLTWENDSSNDGKVYVFMNGKNDGDTTDFKWTNNSITKSLTFTTKSDTTFITIRFGVDNVDESITYSNMMIRHADIIDDTYEVYKPSLQEQVSGLSEAVTYQSVHSTATITSCNDAVDTGNYRVYTSATDRPSDMTYGDMRVLKTQEFISQTMFYLATDNTSKIALRFSIDNGTTFTNWTIFTGTEETPTV